MDVLKCIFSYLRSTRQLPRLVGKQKTAEIPAVVGQRRETSRRLYRKRPTERGFRRHPPAQRHRLGEGVRAHTGESELVFGGPVRWLPKREGKGHQRHVPAHQGNRDKAVETGDKKHQQLCQQQQ